MNAPPTHDELVGSLAAHLRGGTGRMVWTDMQLGPAGTCRPDVYAVAPRFANFAADAYEVKASVSDLRRDTTSGKWQAYLKYAHRVWFAFPRGLVPADDIPRQCGVILRNDDGRWRAARRPVSQPLETLPRNAWLKLLIDGVARLGEPEPSARQADRWAGAEATRRKFGQEIASLLQDRRMAECRYKQATEAMNGLAAELEKRRGEALEQARRYRDREVLELTEAQRRLAEALGLRGNASTDDLLYRLRVVTNLIAHRFDITDLIAALQGLQAVRSERLFAVAQEKEVAA